LEELATFSGTHAPSLYRLLRALAGCGVFREVEPERFALTELGSALKTGAPGAARATLLTIAGDWQWQAWQHFLHTLRTGEPGLRKALGTELFPFLAANPQLGATFNEAMVGMYGGLGPTLVKAYDFSSIPKIIDIGGGTGRLMAAILESHQNVLGAVFELPQTAAEAQRFLSDASLASRCEVIEGDFFKSVPAEYDAYILAHVLHDWDDARAVSILRNCRRSVASGARLLIVEALLPDNDAPHHGKMMDLLMMTVTGGVERSAAEFSKLLASADFEVRRIVATSTHQSLIEAIPV
jgi:ubiquinone/menaquinone biosynthesis C-methylase UbiE